MLNGTGNDVVIIGRGKLVQHHPANIRYRAIIQARLSSYSNAKTKGLKSSILRMVLNDVRSNSANNLGFVKRDTETGRWFAVNDDTARINIAQAFRDGLHSDYKSSKKHKAQKRNDELAISPAATQMDAQHQQKIFSGLNRFETRREEEPHPAKRVRIVTTMQPAATAGEQSSDHTLGRLDGTRERLCALLGSGGSNNNPLLGSVEWAQPRPSLKRKLSSDSIDTFTRLCDKVGNSSNLSRDPFEPMSIQHQSTNEKTGRPENDVATRNETETSVPFPCFAMSIMVDKTNPTGPALSQPSTTADSLDHKVIFDPMPCRSEVISSASLNSLALSDTESTMGMNSLSSLSENMDSHGDQDLQDAFEVFGQFKAQDIEAILMAS